MKTLSVALLGLGTMGSGMAENLLKAGFTLAVYNRTRSKAEPFVAKGARIATTPADAVSRAQVVISMLSDDQASRETWIGKDGALPAAIEGAVLVESSTVSPQWIAELAELARSQAIELLDAPVTGSRVQAEEGQLTFLVGGSELALVTVAPVLQAMSKEIVHLGPTGSGAKMKLVNNFLCGVLVASLAEGLAWLERSGLEREKALRILQNGAPGSPLLGTISARMVNRDYKVNFLLKLMAKDLAYAHSEAERSGIDLTTATNAYRIFERAVAEGYAEEDMSAIIEVLRHPSAA
jgi:3-hydroxyisobutyrate dehydrogenase